VREGKYTIFCIQHAQANGDWVFSSLDYFGTPKGFQFSDDCWQKTGIQGTFDPTQAFCGAQSLSEAWPGTLFRVVQVNVEWRTCAVGKTFFVPGPKCPKCGGTGKISVSVGGGCMGYEDEVVDCGSCKSKATHANLPGDRD